MNNYTAIRTGFADRLHLEVIFWTFTVQQQSWLWNWMGPSIMKQPEMHMTAKEQLI